MDFSNYSINNKGKEEELKNIKSGVRKNQLDKKYHELFDFYDGNGNGTLESEELKKMFNWLVASAKSDKDDKVLSNIENNNFKNIFAKYIKIENSDFMGFIKSVADASQDIEYTKETPAQDGGKIVETKYKDGSIETIAYYPDGDYKYKKFDYEKSNTSLYYTIGSDLNTHHDSAEIENQIREAYNKRQKEVSSQSSNPENKSIKILPDYETFKTQYMAQNKIYPGSDTENFSQHDFEMSNRAKQDAKVRDFVFTHYVESHEIAKKLLDNMGILDDLGALINSGAGEIRNACKNIYNKYFGNGTEEDYKNFYETIEEFSPELAKLEKQKTSAILSPAFAIALYSQLPADKLGSYDKSVTVKPMIENLRNNPETYFTDFETKFNDISGTSYNPQIANDLQTSYNRYQSAQILDNRMKSLKNAVSEISLYAYQQANPKDGDAPAIHLQNAINSVLEYFNNDAELVLTLLGKDALNNEITQNDIKKVTEIFVNEIITNPQKVIDKIKDLQNYTRNLSDNILEGKKLEDLRTDYINNYKTLYNKDITPEEVIKSVQSSKMTGEYVKMAAIIAISVLVAKSPVMAEIGQAANGIQAEGKAAGIVQNLITKYTQKLGSETLAREVVKEGINLSLKTGTVGADALLNAINRLTSTSQSFEGYGQEVASSALYIGAVGFVGEKIAGQVSNVLRHADLGGKLFNGATKASTKSGQISTISGDKLLSNFINDVTAKSGGFLSEVGTFSLFETIFNGTDLGNATKENLENFGILSIMSHLIQALIGGHTTPGFEKIYIDNAINNAEIKKLNIKEIANNGKIEYSIEKDGQLILNCKTKEELATFVLEAITKEFVKENPEILQKEIVNIKKPKDINNKNSTGEIKTPEDFSKMSYSEITELFKNNNTYQNYQITYLTANKKMFRIDDISENAPVVKNIDELENLENPSKSYIYSVQKDGTLKIEQKEISATVKKTVKDKNGQEKTLNQAFSITEFPDGTKKRSYHDNFKYPQEANYIIEETIDNDGKILDRTILKQDKTNPDVIVTVKEIYDKSGNVVEEIKEPGTITKKNGETIIEKEFISPSKDKIRSKSIENSKELITEFEVIDVKISRNFQKINEKNTTITTVTNKNIGTNETSIRTYKSVFGQNDLTITRTTPDGRTNEVKFCFDSLENCKKANKNTPKEIYIPNEFRELFKKMPGDLLYNMHINRIKMDIAHSLSDTGFNPNNSTIKLMDVYFDDPFTLAHEIGHGINHRYGTYITDVPIHKTKKIQNIYKEEKAEFLKHSSVAEQKIAGYFVELPIEKTSKNPTETVDTDRPLDEIVAETLATSAGLRNGKTPDVLLRNEIMQKYFPKTIEAILNEYRIAIE